MERPLPLTDALRRNNSKSGERVTTPSPATSSQSATDADSDANMVLPQDLIAKSHQLMEEENYAEALVAHERALELYKQQQPHQRESVVSCCNEATAWRYKGSIHQKLEDYTSAIASWKTAEELFRNCRERILVECPLDGPMQTSPIPPEKQICLDACIVDVLQWRADAYMALEDQFRNAIDCHEEVIDLLLDIHRSGEHNLPDQLPIEGIGFVRMEASRNTEALISSLESLGALYTSTGAYEDGLAAFEEALQILRARQKTNGGNQHEVLSMSKILFSLSELYLERNDIEHSIETLHETLDLRTSIEESLISNFTREALEALDRAGQIAEDSGRLDYAITCYEKVLLTRNHFWGDKHIDVAKSLVNVGRVLELQGNTEGSLDLYRAAQTIYAAQVTAKDFTVNPEDVETVLQLIPNLFDQERYDEAVAYLNKCLESETDEEKKNDSQNTSQIDRTQIYFTLGEAYIGLGDYVSATVCLVECAKQEGSVPEEDIAMMLERVEFLKREELGLGTSRTDDSQARLKDDSADSSAVPRSRQRIASDELSFVPPEGTADETSIPGTPKMKESRRIGHSGDSHPSSTPLTEEISQSGSQPSRNTPEERANSTKVGKREQGLDGARYDMDMGEIDDRSEIKRSSSDLSSSFLSSDTSALDLSHLSVDLPDDGDVGQEIPSSDREGSPHNGVKGEANLLLRPSRTADSYERRKSRALRIPSPRKKGGSRGPKTPESGASKSRVKLARGFRRTRRGFESLPEEDKEPTAALKRDEEFHDDESVTESILDGPVKQFDIPIESWDDVSQITFVYNDGNRSWQRGNEWWWGVSAEGFGRWFPSQFVSQAVEVADGFLSARAIHSKVRSAPLDVVSDDESVDSHIEDKDHASNVGVAKEKMSFGGLSLGAHEADAENNAEAARRSSDLQAMIGASSTVRRNGKGDTTEQDIAKLTDSLAEQRKTSTAQDPQIASTLFRLAVLQSRGGDINSAIQSSAESLHIHRENGNASEVAHNLHFLADLYLHQKQYKSSLSYYVEALEIEHEVYGEYSEESAKTLNSIGAVRSMQNEFKLAMESHKEALRVLKECHGEDLQGNPLVSQTLCQIGAVYYRERNALSTIKSKKDDYSTFVEAGMLEVIGRAHEERGSYKMAIAFFEEKLQFLENDDTSSSEDLATTLNSLGMLSSRAGLYIEALDYYERALSVQRSLGCDEIYVATAQVLKGTVKYQLGLWDEALVLLEGALTTLREELGSDHETVAATLYHIGVVKAATCEYDSAMSALKDALQIQNTLLGQDHPAALRTRREIGNMFAVYPSEMTTAFEHFTAVLSGQQKIHGVKHPNIAETLHAIGCAYARRRDFSTALKILEECYYMRLEFLGVDHPLQATTLHEIAKIHVKRESFKKALRICDTVLDIRKESLSEGHIDYARALATRGSSLVGKGDFNTALSCATEALRVCTEAVHPEHPAIAEIQIIIGGIHLRNCQFQEAHTAVEEAIAIYRQSDIDDDYPGLHEAQKLLERIERDEMLFV